MAICKHYNYFRDYDSAIGRYIQSDPLGLRAGSNTYNYVSARPLARIDPFGLEDAAGGGQPSPCRPAPCVKTCLDKVLGEDVGGTNVVTESGFAKLHGYATTRKNTIYVDDTCSGFFGNPFTVLEEYYHVTKQWNTGRLTRYRYLRDNVRDGGYDNNRWEVEAKNFAGNNLGGFKACIACCNK